MCALKALRSSDSSSWKGVTTGGIIPASFIEYDSVSFDCKLTITAHPAKEPSGTYRPCVYPSSLTASSVFLSPPEDAVSRLPAGAVPLPPPTLAERHETNELMRVVRSYTHLVVSDIRAQRLGTAVLLRHGDRLFAFTAAHNIADDTAIHVRLGLGAERTLFRVLDTFIHPRYNPEPRTSTFDLAILELENIPAVEAGDVAQLYTGEIRRRPEGQPESADNTTFVWVVGFPSDLAQVRDGIVSVYQTAFGTQMLDATPDVLSLYYPMIAYQMPQDGMTCEIGELASTPRGYSGGGVWAMRVPDGGMFYPHRHIRLVGLQTHWCERSRMIRCVPSAVMAEAFRQRWLELV